LNIPAKTTDIYAQCFNGCTSLNSILVDAANTAYCSEDGVLFNKAKTRLMQYPLAKTGIYVIPATVTLIDKAAFSGSVNLETINIPSGISVIDQETFSNCMNLKFVSISSSVTAINSKAFSGNVNLQKLVVNKTTPVSIGSDVFNAVNIANVLLEVPEGSFAAYNAALIWKTFALYESGQQAPIFEQEGLRYKIISNEEKTLKFMPRLPAYTGNIVIPQTVMVGGDIYTVTTLAEKAFTDNTLIDVTIPATVTSYENYVFDGCSRLEKIVVLNSVPPSIGLYVFYHLSMADCLLEVPLGSKTAYTSANYWKEFCVFETGETEPIFTSSGIRYKITGYDTPAVKTIRHRGVDYQGNVSIPAQVTHNEITFDVTRIDNNTFASALNLNAVSIPVSVTEIGNSAFYNCRELVSIDIPNSVTTIEPNAFFECSKLSTVVLSEQITVIPNYLFGQCDSLKSIVLPQSVKTISDGAFSGCSSLTDIQFGDSVNYIGYSVFEYCTALNDVTLPTLIKKIEPGTFKSCTGLITITLPDSITSIGNLAFNGCTNLTSIHLPDSLESLGLQVFTNCTELRNITFPPKVKEIHFEAFRNCVNLRSVNMPVSLEKIYSHAFSNCSRLEQLTLPDNLVTIEPAAFSYCTNLMTVSMGSSIESIGYHAFYQCENISAIAFPSSLKSIDHNAFAGCRALTTIEIPASVNFITDNAFSVCTSLSSVKVTWSTPLSISTGTNATFRPDDVENCILYVPVGTKVLYEAAPGWQDFGQIVEYFVTDTKAVGDCKVEIYPNSASDFIFVSGLNENSSITIYNIEGKVMKTMQVSNCTINIRDLERGVYFFRFADRNGKSTVHRVWKK
jgi:hypothetical protein